MMDNPQVPIALPLAQVQTPTGAVWYIPRAQRHGEFVVQRRYQKVGKPQHMIDMEEERVWEIVGQCTAHQVPFLNPGAVRAAGLDLGTIMNQFAEQPEQIFMHPTYAQLCLRWGVNPGGYTVTEYVQKPLPDDRAIPFIPHTCWLTGTTYYQLDSAEQGEMWEKLMLRAGLKAHEQELGLEGDWNGWYALNFKSVEQVLAESGHYPVVASAQIWYGIKVLERPSGIEHWIRVYPVAEEALAFYQQSPAVDNGASTQPWTMLHYGFITQWPGRIPEWQVLDEKEIEAERAACLIAGKGVGLHSPQTLPMRMMRGVLAEIDWPLTRRITTLKDRLDATSVSRVQLAHELEWPLTKLLQCEHNPEVLTLAEIRQLAQVTAILEETLMQELSREAQIRAAEKKWRVNAGNSKVGVK
jgi:hypothetical protein